MVLYYLLKNEQIGASFWIFVSNITIYDYTSYDYTSKMFFPNCFMSLEFEPLRFAVEKILPHGLFIMAGSGKIGKSWLSLDICQAVAIGGKLWDYAA